jgi:hypothetical protein
MRVCVYPALGGKAKARTRLAFFSAEFTTGRLAIGFAARGVRAIAPTETPTAKSQSYKENAKTSEESQ